MFFCTCVQSKAQTHELTTQVLGGVFYVPGKELYNDVGINQQVFGGFKPGLTVEAAAYYHFRRHMILGLAAGYWAASKPNFAMSSFDTKLRLGYMFNPNPKYFYPYFFGGIGLAEMRLDRSKYNKVYSSSSQNFDQTGVSVTRLNNTYGELDLQYPVPMAEIGIGIDIVTYRRWSLGMQAVAGYYFARESQAISSEYKSNKGRLLSVSASVGVSYTILYRDHPKDINNFHAKNKYNKEYNKHKKQGAKAAKKDPKLVQLAHTQVPHNSTGASTASKPKEVVLSEPLNVHTIDKTKYDSKKNISVLGKIKGSITGNEVVVLTDEKGNVVQKVNTKHGYFAYTNLKPDNYTIKFQNSNPNLKAEIKVAEEDPNAKISSDEFKKYQYKKISGDPFDNMVQGKLKVPNAAGMENQDVSIVLVNDKNEVVARTKTNANGQFAFQKLRADNYTALAETPDNSLKAEIKLADDDPSLRMTVAQLKNYRYHALNQELVDGAIVVGKISSSAQNIPIEDQTVFIVDSKGNISETKTNAQGQFAFKSLTADNHQVYLENPDPNLKVTAHPVEDSPEMMVDKERMLKYNFNKLKADDVPNNVLLGKVNVKDLPKDAADVEILLLDDAGNVVTSTVANKEGQFSFHNLKADNYKAVVNSPDRMQAQLHTPVNDPNLAFKSSDLTTFNPKTRKYEKLRPDELVVVTGTIKEQGSVLPLEDHSVFLVDDKGVIAEVVKTEKDGSFHFSEKKQGNYQVLYETKDGKNYEHDVKLYKGTTDGNAGASAQSNGKHERMVMHYEKGKDIVNQTDTSKFSHLIHLFKTNPKAKVELKAYASSNEKESGDVHQLNLKRMEALRKRLIASGVSAEKIKVKDMGLPLLKPSQDSSPEEDVSKVEIEVLD